MQRVFWDVWKREVEDYFGTQGLQSYKFKLVKISLCKLKNTTKLKVEIS